MIFVTVGGQLPFDRLIRAVDGWSAARGRTDVEAQIGDGKFEPAHVRYHRFLSPGDFRLAATRADAIVAHAGMGTILLALELGKPILVMPRRAADGEHRNDHQLATARSLSSRGLVTVAADEHELLSLLDQLESRAVGNRIELEADPRLIRRIREAALSQ